MPWCNPMTLNFEGIDWQKPRFHHNFCSYEDLGHWAEGKQSTRTGSNYPGRLWGKWSINFTDNVSFISALSSLFEQCEWQKTKHSVHGCCFGPGISRGTSRSISFFFTWSTPTNPKDRNSKTGFAKQRRRKNSIQIYLELCNSTLNMAIVKNEQRMNELMSESAASM